MSKASESSDSNLQSGNIVQAGETSLHYTQKKNKIPKKLLKKLIPIIIVFCLAIVGIYYSIVSYHKAHPVVGNACSSSTDDTTMQDALVALHPVDTTALLHVVASIQTRPNYDQDPNCLYVVLTYFINVGDVQSSSSYLSKLEKVYNPKVGFSSELGPTYDLKTLQIDVSGLQQSQQQAKKNIKTFGNP